MEMPGDIKKVLVPYIKKIEFIRFMKGLGKMAFVKELGIHIYTYNSFIKSDRFSKPQTLNAIINYIDEYEKAEKDPIPKKVLER